MKFFSNAWPPLQEIVVTGLEKSGYPPAKELALNIVKRWVKNGYLAYKDTKEKSGKPIFFEKYDVENVSLGLLSTEIRSYFCIKCCIMYLLGIYYPYLF